MGKVGGKKRPAAASLRGNGSEGEDSGEDAKRPGSARSPPSHTRDPMNAPVLAANKAVAPRKVAAANASVVTTDGETSKGRPIGQYDNFLLEMQRIEKGRPLKTNTPVVGSPGKFSSPARPKASKVWVAGLKSGEMVAYVTDRFNPDSPAFIKVGLDRLRDDPVLCEKAMISKFMHKKADKQPFKAWTLSKVSQAGTSYTLYWFVIVRRFKDLADHTPQARNAWGVSLAKLFELTDEPNKFEYGGDLSKDQACPASDFFSVQDVMEKLVKKRLAGYMSESEIVQNSHLMASYYGDDPVLNREVTQMYMPNEQQLDEGVDEEKAKRNQELHDLF